MKKLAVCVCAAVAAAVSAFGSMPPSPYVPVEWVQLSGNGTSLAKISTGVVIEETMKLEFKVSLDDTVNYGSTFKDYIDEGHNTTRIIRAETSGDTLYVCFHSKADGSTRVTALKNATDPIEGWMMKGQANINGITTAISTTQGTANDTPLCFQSKDNSSMHFYYLRIFNNGEPLVEYVPCVNANDPTDCGIWNGTEVLKSATGTVTAGPAAKLAVAEIKAQAYTGLPVEPELTVTFGGSILTKGTDYSVAYANNVAIGEATATVTGLNGYSGMSAEAKFQIKEIETYDGRLIGGAWGTASNWEGGEVVDGVGKKITTKWQSITMPYSSGAALTNVTIGSLHVEGTGSGDVTLLSPSADTGGHSFGFLTFDSGDADTASTLVFEPLKNASGAVVNQYATIDVDTILKNDLKITSLRESGDAAAAGGAFLRWKGDISDAGTGHGFTLDCLTEAARMAIFGDNDFSGDVTVKKGRLELFARDRATGPATQLGHDNTIRVKDGGTLEIGNFSFGADQNFELAGLGYNGGLDANGKVRPAAGALAVSGQNRTDHPTIAGSVTLTADAGIGTGVSRMAGGPGEGNDLDITGVVSDGGNGYSLALLGAHKVTLSNPANSFRALYVTNGLVKATSAAALGTKEVHFARGVWGPNTWSSIYLNGGFALVPEFDITDPDYGITLKVAKATWNNPAVPYTALNLAVEDGDVTLEHPLTVAPEEEGGAQPPLVKFGPDRLTLKRLGNTGDVYVYGGGLTLDYSQESALPEKLSGLYAGAGASEIVLRGGDEPFTTALNGFGPKSDLSVFKLTVDGAEGSAVKESPHVRNLLSVTDLDISDSVRFVAFGSYLSGNLLHPIYLWKGGTAFCKHRGYSWSALKDQGLAPYDGAVTTWTTDEGVADKDVPHVDAKDDIATTVPDGARAATLRFCDPNVRALDLDGRLSVMLTENSGYHWGYGGGAILVTPQMGEGDVEIRGGELTGTRSYDYYLYIHQWNTNGVLRISSDLVNPADGIALTVVKTGPGKVVFSGRVQTTGQFVILGGEVEFASSECWSTKPSALKMTNNAKLTLKGGDYGSLPLNTVGMGTSVVDLVGTETALKLTGTMYMQPYARLSKIGEGALDLSSTTIQPNKLSLPKSVEAELDLAEGTVDFKTGCLATKENLKLLVRCRNDVVIKNASVLRGSTTDTGTYHVPSSLRQCAQLKIEGDAESGAIFDLCGANSSLLFTYGDANNILLDTFFGDGRIKIVNSSATAATLDFGSWEGPFYAPSFTGVFDAGSFLNKVTLGGGLPNAVLKLDGSVMIDGSQFTRHNYVAFGGVTGSGSVRLAGGGPAARVVLGREADETLTFDGLWTASGSPTYTKYVKRGSNAQAFSCPSNTFGSGWQVRGGELRTSGGGGVVEGPSVVQKPGWSGSDFAGTDLTLDTSIRAMIDGNDASKGEYAFSESRHQPFAGEGVSVENPYWCVYGFKYPQRVNAIGLQSYDRKWQPSTLEIYGSADNAAWTHLASVTVNPAGNDFGGFWQQINFANMTAWTYYKIVVTGAISDRSEKNDFKIGRFSFHCVAKSDGSLGDKAIQIGAGPDPEQDWLPRSLGAAGDSAAFLAGAAVTNGNGFAFGTAADEVMVGTAHASGTSVFTSDLELTRDVTLHAEGASEAIFTGFITGSGAIKISGTGKVSFKSPVTTAGEDWAFDDLTGLTFEGGLAVPEGTVLDLSGIVDKLAPGGRYALITAPGGFTGSFTVTGLPDTWNAKWKKGVLTVYETPGLMLLLR